MSNLWLDVRARAMGGTSSSPNDTETADAAVENAAKAWEQVSADLKVAVDNSDQASAAVRKVLKRYDATQKDKGGLNYAKQLADRLRKKIKGSALSSKQLKNLIALQSEVFNFTTTLAGAEVANSQMGDQLTKRLANFNAYLDTLRTLTSESPPTKAAGFTHVVL